MDKNDLLGYSTQFGYSAKYNKQGPELFWKNVLKSPIDKYNRHGISDEIEPLRGEELTETVRKSKRPLSIKLDQNAKLQAALDEEAKKPRTFIRTWVRLMPLKKI